MTFTNLNASDITLSRSGQHMLVGINATGKTIKIDYQFYSQAANRVIEKFAFADGSTWNLQTINANACYRGTSGSDSITGSSWDETFAGTALMRNRRHRRRLKSVFGRYILNSVGTGLPLQKY